MQIKVASTGNVLFI